MTARPTDRFVRVADALSATVDDEIVLLSPALRDYIALDNIGRRIWELLETPRSMADLCAVLSAEFDATAEQIAADVGPFLQQLLDERLITRVEE